MQDQFPEGVPDVQNPYVVHEGNAYQAQAAPDEVMQAEGAVVEDFDDQDAGDEADATTVFTMEFDVSANIPQQPVLVVEQMGPRSSRRGQRGARRN